jgi:hypothetical protein
LDGGGALGGVFGGGCVALALRATPMSRVNMSAVAPDFIAWWRDFIIDSSFLFGGAE